MKLRPLDDKSVRHLLYHVWPVKGNGVWRWNCARLLKRIDLFNGRRVCAVVESRDSETVDDVRKALGDSFTYVGPFRNDPKLREVVTWLPLWEQVKDCTGPLSYTFYAHAKGVTKPESTQVRRWTEWMYELNLDYWPDVLDLLKHFPLVGSFKRVGKLFAESKSAWHYGGTFFWARSADVFELDRYKKIDQFWGGNEAWPGCRFPPERGGCLFMVSAEKRFNLYDPKFQDEIAEHLKKWKEDRK